MAQSEDDVYRRIARQNGTTVEQEKAKQRQRDAKTARANGLIENTESTDVVESDATNNSTEEGTTTPASNPFVVALVAIYTTGFVVGVILVLIGAANAESYTPDDFSAHPDNGIAWIIWGGAFLNLGIVAALIHIGSAAVIWRLDNAGDQEG